MPYNANKKTSCWKWKWIARHLHGNSCHYVSLCVNHELQLQVESFLSPKRSYSSLNDVCDSYMCFYRSLCAHSFQIVAHISTQTDSRQEMYSKRDAFKGNVRQCATRGGWYLCSSIQQKKHGFVKKKREGGSGSVMKEGGYSPFMIFFSSSSFASPPRLPWSTWAGSSEEIEAVIRGGVGTSESAVLGILGATHTVLHATYSQITHTPKKPYVKMILWLIYITADSVHKE